MLLTCIVALSIGRSEGFFNTPAVPTRIAITTCVDGDVVVFKAKTTDNTTISNVFLVNHSSKNSLEAGESTDTIMVHSVTVTPTETTIGDASLSRMVIGKKYYVIQVAAATASNADAKKYKVPAVTPAANATPAALNTLMGVYTHSTPSPCNARITANACMKGDQMVLNAKTTDTTTVPNVYVVYHSSKNSLEAGESTDQILVTNANVTKTESTIHTFRPSNMVAGKKYYIIQVTAATDPNAKKYKVPSAAPVPDSTAPPNTLMGVYTYSAPPPCPSQYERNVDQARSSRSDDSSTRTSRSSRSSGSNANNANNANNDTRSRYRSDAPTAAHWRTFDRQDPSGAAVSGTSDQAKSLKQRMDILSDIQTLMKRKTLETRRAPYKSDCKQNACDEPSASLSQGREYKSACDHDMSQYIRKDSIPCWKCNLDY